MVGALVLAQLMAAGGVGSPAFIIAFYLTSWMGKGYLAIAGVCVCVAGGDEGRASGEALQSPSGLLGPYWHDMSVLVTFFTLRQAFNPFHERHCCLTQLRCCVVCNCLAHTGFIGALGSFVSGSVLGSNMTQGAIQAVAAERLGVSVTSMLAVQVAGACAGKMVCIGSILVSSLTHVGVGSASN